MAKLHELLAVNSNLAGQATKVLTELKATFEKKRHLFEEKKVVFLADEENSAPVVESQSDIQTTVAKELKWISEHLAKQVDTAHAIDVANTSAKADVLIEGADTPLLKDVPATTLLQLEKRLTEWKSLLIAIPTLDPAKGFTQDQVRGKGYYQAREVVKTRTKKKNVVLELAPATDKHPRQAQVFAEDFPIGKIQEQEWSSLITPAEKTELIERAEALYRAVAAARSKANEAHVDTKNLKIGDTLLGYILQPVTA